MFARQPPPISGVSASPTARVAGGVGQRACSAAVARVVDVLAGGPIRGGLQAHDAVVPWPSSHRALTPALLPRETNPAALVTLIYLCCFSRLCKACPTTTAHSATVGRVMRVVRPGVSAEAREVAAGGFPMDARRGT